MSTDRLSPRCGLLAAVAAARGPGRTCAKFYDDDPLAREPETQDASKVTDRDIALPTTWPRTCLGRLATPARFGR